MIQVVVKASVVLLAYLFGSIPFGLLIVKLTTGKDIRQVASGRTGGTNAARAAGLVAGLLTALLDAGKGAAAVWVAQAVSPADHWLHVLAPVAAILGHNHSVFLAERDTTGRIRLRGGAGGGTTGGGAFGLWPGSALITAPLTLLVFFGIGYASVTTLSIALTITVIFGVRYALGLSPLPDVVYGVAAFIILAWALRPNIQALIEGRERFHGWRPWRKKTAAPPDDQDRMSSTARVPTRPARRIAGRAHKSGNRSNGKRPAAAKR